MSPKGAILLACGMSIITHQAYAGSIDVAKNETITMPAGFLLTANGIGQAIARADSSTVQQFDPKSKVFSLNGRADSLPTLTADAQVGNYRGIAMTEVGKVTGGVGTVSIPATLRTIVQWPDKPPRFGGFASALSTVRMFSNVTGVKVTVKSLTVNGIKIKGGAGVPKILDDAKDKGARVKDPIHLFAEDLATGETINTNVYENDYFVIDGASAGFNSSGLLELTTPDLSIRATAKFDSSTLVPFATNLSGDARLHDGMLTATGVFDPDPALPITDFWQLTYSPGDPAYIDDAVFLASSEFEEIDITPSFTDPGTSDSDPVLLGLDMSLQAAESAVPEPDTLGLFAVGLLGLTGTARRNARRRRRAKSGAR